MIYCKSSCCSLNTLNELHLYACVCFRNHTFFSWCCVVQCLIWQTWLPHPPNATKYTLSVNSEKTLTEECRTAESTKKDKHEQTNKKSLEEEQRKGHENVATTFKNKFLSDNNCHFKSKRNQFFLHNSELWIVSFIMRICYTNNAFADEIKYLISNIVLSTDKYRHFECGFLFTLRTRRFFCQTWSIISNELDNGFPCHSQMTKILKWFLLTRWVFLLN